MQEFQIRESFNLFCKFYLHEMLGYLFINFRMNIISCKHNVVEDHTCMYDYFQRLIFFSPHCFKLAQTSYPTQIPPIEHFDDSHFLEAEI